MNSESSFRIAFFVLFVAVMAVRAYYGWRVRRTGRDSRSLTQDAVTREGRWSVLLRFVLFLYMLAAIVLYAANPSWLDRLAIPFPPWLRWAGAGLSLVSIPLLIWVHHTLGKHWSTNLQLRETHSLVTLGPYRWVRHPMYTALFGFFIGLALLSASWLVVPLVVVAILVLYARIGREEAMMTEKFGQDYRAYVQRTGRLLPRLIHKSG